MYVRAREILAPSISISDRALQRDSSFRTTSMAVVQAGKGQQCPPNGRSVQSRAAVCNQGHEWGEHSSKLWGNPFTNTKQASARAHKEQSHSLITLDQQHLEHTGDECAPCTRSARRKGMKTRELRQTAGQRHTHTKRASARAHKEQH